MAQTIPTAPIQERFNKKRKRKPKLSKSLHQAEGKGLEPVDVTALQDTGLQLLEKSRAAESGAICDREAVDADLAVLIAAWPALPAEVKDELGRLVKNAITH